MTDQTPTTKRTPTKEERQIRRSAIREDAIRGMTRAEIAAKHQVKQGLVYRLTKGMSLVTLRDQQHARHERFCTLFKKGLSVPAICHLEQVATDTVIKVLKAQGLWQKKLDEKAAFNAEVLQYWLDTRLPLVQIAAKFGIGKWRAAVILKKHPEYDGQAVKDIYLYKSIQIPDDEKEAILKMRDELHTIEYIAQKFGYGRQSLGKFLRENGRDWHLKKKRGKWWVPPEDEKQILACRQSGMTLKQTSLKTGYHKRAITIVCHRLGYKGVGTIKPLSEDEQQVIHRMRAEGASVKHMAKVMNRGQKVIVSYMEKAGFSFARKIKLKPDEQDFILLARREGAPIRQVAQVIGRHYGTVKRICHKNGLGRTWKLGSVCHLKSFIQRLQGFDPHAR